MAGREVSNSERLSAVVFRIVGFIMWMAPIGAFRAIAFTVGRFGAGSLASLGALLIEFYVVCLLFVFAVLGAVARYCGVSLFRLLYYIRDEILIVAATTSSETVLPRLVQKLEAQALDPWPSTPEEFSAKLKTDFDKYAKLIKLSGAKIE